MRKTKLYNLWVTVQNSFWFIPTTMIFVSFCASIVTLQMDNELEYQLFLQSLHIGKDSLLDNFLVVGPDGARSVLTTIAGSMITVAGVTFSITIVALTLATSQFGPRLLGNFIQDRSTQFVLGSFNSTFVYCLLILRSIQSSQNTLFVPTVSVNLAVVLAIFNVGILIFFIHHISISLKAEKVITSVFNGLKRDIDRIFKDVRIDENGETVGNDHQHSQKIDERYSRETAVNNKSDGYLQAIDHDKLMDICDQHDLVLELYQKAGDFTVAGAAVARARSTSWPGENVLNEIGSAFIYGSQRTPEQDVEYAIHQMVEVGVRSLSKGINDPFTAISCIDYLAAVLCTLSGKKLPNSHCHDSQGNLRLIIKTVSYGDFLDSAFNQLRQNSRSSIAVTIRLMEAFIHIAACLKDTAHKEHLHRHVKMLKSEADGSINEKQDREDFQARYDECISLLGFS